MIFQQHQLIGRLSALDNVMTGRLGYHSGWRTLFPMPRSDRRLGLECLERVGLLDKALVRADQLSGGQQQRVGIARALVQKPQLVLADEPVASLDPETAVEVLSQLREICTADGITAVISFIQIDLARPVRRPGHCYARRGSGCGRRCRRTDRSNVCVDLPQRPRNPTTHKICPTTSMINL